MRVYIQSDSNHIPHNYNFFNAYQGFREMGFETVPFHTPEELQTSQKSDLVVGYVDTVRQRLFDFGITTPELGYPEELQNYLGRKIWPARMSHIANHPERWPVFVKPVEDKRFTGTVVRSTKDLIGCGGDGQDFAVTCSEIVDFKAEWRCFVRYGKILAVKPYKGDWHLHYDPHVIETAVQRYKSAPWGYAMDFGVTNDGHTLLIEVNDGYALGCYGHFYLDYAKLMSARWAELTGTEDECAFDLLRL